MNFEYHTYQFAPNITIEPGDNEWEAAAEYLGERINHFAKYGWQFLRIDQIGVYKKRGCIAALFGQSGQLTLHYVATFQRPAKLHSDTKKDKIE